MLASLALAVLPPRPSLPVLAIRAEPADPGLLERLSQNVTAFLGDIRHRFQTVAARVTLALIGRELIRLPPRPTLPVLDPPRSATVSIDDLGRAMDAILDVHHSHRAEQLSAALTLAQVGQVLRTWPPRKPLRIPRSRPASPPALTLTGLDTAFHGYLDHIRALDAPQHNIASRPPTRPGLIAPVRPRDPGRAL